MLDTKIFIREVEKIVLEYSDKGFEMTKERARLWYDNFKTMDDESFTAAISKVLKKCSFSPTIADITRNAVGLNNQSN